MNIENYWEQKTVVSMKDHRVSNIESSMIAEFVSKDDTLLNIGCGDGSGCFKYRDKCKSYLGIERSNEMITRFRKHSAHPVLHADVLTADAPAQFSCVVSQRCMINLGTIENQRLVLEKMINWLEPGGRLIICEAFDEGLKSLNQARIQLGIDPIIPHWHALYLPDNFFDRPELTLIGEKDLSGYFLLTRVLHAALSDNPSTESDLNKIAEKLQLENKEFQEIKNFSFIKIKVFEK